MRRNRRKKDDDGWGEWGNYFDAKKAKLAEQFKQSTENQIEKKSNIFQGIYILVNGHTSPSSEELKLLMASHGGVYQVYQNSSTTHIIASNLPNVKINKLGSVPIVKPSWITDSIELSKLLDYKRYFLYTNQSITQPKLEFPAIAKTASDPNFLAEFYNNSRLHLIATLGAEYKQMITELRARPVSEFPGRDKLLSLQSSRESPHFPVIMHIDMDCFFVSVGLRKHPELKGLPLAVTHARNGINSTAKDAEVAMNLDRLPEPLEVIDGKSSMSEVASCSYEARKCGVRNGMFLGAAVKLCPNLQTIPYDFDGYKEISLILYETLVSYTLDIEAVSCDEMYVDITELLKTFNISVLDWAEHIRAEIMAKTQCPCSTGFGGNRLQARLATRKAKPAGTFHLQAVDVEHYMSSILLSDLPGVGRVNLEKLRSLGFITCGDVQTASLQLLQQELGVKTAATIYDQVKGVDTKPLNFNYERKSVSAEINYGIRFKTLNECHSFLDSLAKEVWSRLSEVKLRTRCVTLKIMVRSADAPLETAKFLGHGLCDNLSKSSTTPTFISSHSMIYEEVKKLYKKFAVDFTELRGLGIQLTKLEKFANKSSALSKFLQQENQVKEEIQISEEKKPEVTKPINKESPTERKKRKVPIEQKNKIDINAFKSQKKTLTVKKGEVDLEVLNELPLEVRNEIMQEYDLKVETKKSVFQGLDWGDLKPILYHWLKSTESPTLIDGEMLGRHLRELALNRQIETLGVCFNFLYRNLAPLNCLWHKIYGVVLQMAQEGMLIKYGAKLQIAERFNCCAIGPNT